MLLRVLVILVGFFLSFSAVADTESTEEISSENWDNRWSIIANLGYTHYQDMYRSQGQTVAGRVALAAEVLALSHASFGLEFGAQNGNRMRVLMPQNNLGVLGYAVQSTLKPMIDFLVTANANPLGDSLLFTQVKGGVAYRYWKMDNSWIQSRSELAGEVQAGFGYPLTELTSLNLLYQGVFGGNPRPRFNPQTEIGYFANIPVQHGVLFGITVIV